MSPWTASKVRSLAWRGAAATLVVCVLGSLAALFILGGLWVSQQNHSVTFQSRESRTVSDGPVFNRVRYVREGQRDVWILEQSHKGISALAETAAASDRFVIAVEDGRATFQQFAPGSANALARQETRAREHEVEYGVACGVCHANGPRALRPDLSSRKAPLSVRDRLAVFVWNLKISTGRRIAALETRLPVTEGGTQRKVAFGPRASFWNERLDIPSCNRCHGGSHPLARAPLLRRNFATIAFLVNAGDMPPPLHPFPEADRQRLASFLSGLAPIASAAAD